MKLNRISLKWKLFSYILIFSIIVLVVVCVFQILLLENFYKTTKIKQTKNIMKEVYALVNDSSINDLKNNESSIISKIKQSTKDFEAEVYLVSKEQITEPKLENKFEFIYPSSTSTTDFYANVLSFDDLTVVFNQIENPGKPSFVVEDSNPLAPSNIKMVPDASSLEVSNLIFCERFTLKNGLTNYMIIINSRITPVAPAISTLKTQLLYIVIIVIILSILVALIMSKVISSPIINMNEEAKKLAAGKYNLTFQNQGFKEILELNDTLNYAIEELKKTEVLQRELIANISHDLRTPLTLIAGYAQMMKDFPEDDQTKNVQIIIDETNRLQNLVSDLLVLSRIAAKTEPLKKTTFNITECLLEIITRHQEFVKAQNIQINFHYKTTVEVCADRAKIEQVIYNFLTNAINYSGESKIIDVIQEEFNDTVKITFKDYGIGIKEEDLEYVWQRFYRVDKGLTRSTQGSGLGLSIVKSILDYHGFSYGVSSKYKEGSEFYFEMPLNKKS